MVTHYFTLRALSQEFNALLRDVIIDEIFSQQKNEVVISFTGRQQLQANGLSHSLVVSVDPKLNYFYVREKIARAKKNSVDLFHDIVGLSIKGVTMRSHDRIVQCELNNGSKLLAQLYNTVASNVILLDEHNTIQETFKDNKALKGNVLADDEQRFDPRILENAELFRKQIMSDSSKAVFLALKQTISVFGSTYTRETLHRARIDEKIGIKELDEDEIDRIQEEARTMFREVDQYKPVVYYRGGEAKVLSMTPLQHLAGSETEIFQSANEAVRSFIAKRFRAQGMESEKKVLLGKIKKELEQTRRSLEAIREQAGSSDRADEYERIGKVIMANLQHLTKGTKQVDIPDIFAEEKSIHIVLDPKLTPARNAERYFEKAKKSRSARGQSEQQLQIGREKIALLEKLLLHLDNCYTTEQVKEFKKEYEVPLTSMKLLPRKEGEEQLPFRLFTVTGGFEVLVGKSSTNNDLLTMKYAKPNDLWFHARGASGSHTVLKLSGGKSMPSKEAIHQAASIAAYYSKMRNARNVPVAYCERKYVRKPKGSPEGTVILEREKVIFVTPALP